MTRKKHTVKVVSFPLVPVGGGKNINDARHRVLLAGFDFHPDPLVLVRAQEMVDDVEALLALWIVDTTNINEADETAFGVVAEIGQNLDDRPSLGGEGQLVQGYGRACHPTFEVGRNPLAQVVQTVNVGHWRS
jgi:hypothetical protein